MYKSKVYGVVILCICELVINWSLFLVGNEITLVTLPKATASYIKPEDGKGKGKLNLFPCSTKHHSSKMYCEVGGMDPCTLYLDTWSNWLFSFAPRLLCSHEMFRLFGGKKNLLLAIERRFFGHLDNIPKRCLLTRNQDLQPFIKNY
jgi:hypothetical protein